MWLVWVEVCRCMWTDSKEWQDVLHAACLCRWCFLVCLASLWCICDKMMSHALSWSLKCLSAIAEMGWVCHTSVSSKRLVGDMLTPRTSLLTHSHWNDNLFCFTFELVILVTYLLPGIAIVTTQHYVGCQTITRSAPLDADERIRISVYDYDFGM